MTSRYFGCFQFIDVSTSNKKQIFKLSEEGDLAKMSFFTIFYGNICYLKQNSASPVPDHTQTQRNGAQITLPLSTEQPGSHENSGFRRLSLSVIYGIYIYIYIYI